jgi:hypothetical protein
LPYRALTALYKYTSPLLLHLPSSTTLSRSDDTVFLDPILPTTDNKYHRFARAFSHSDKMDDSSIDFTDIGYQSFADEDMGSMVGVDDTENAMLREEVAALNVKLEQAETEIETLKRKSKDDEAKIMRLEKRHTDRAYGIKQILDLSNKFPEPGRTKTPEECAFPPQPLTGASHAPSLSSWYRFISQSIARSRFYGAKLTELYKKFVGTEVPRSHEAVLEGFLKRLNRLQELEQKQSKPQISNLVHDVAFASYANHIIVETHINKVAFTVGQLKNGVVSIACLLSEVDDLATTVSNLGVRLCNTFQPQEAIQKLIEAQGGTDHETIRAVLGLLDMEIGQATPQTAPALKARFFDLVQSMTSEIDAQMQMIDTTSGYSTEDIEFLKKKMAHAIASSKQAAPNFNALINPVQPEVNLITPLPRLRSSFTATHWASLLDGSSLPYTFHKQTGVIQLKPQALPQGGFYVHNAMLTASKGPEVKATAPTAAPKKPDIASSSSQPPPKGTPPSTSQPTVKDKTKLSQVTTTDGQGPGIPRTSLAPSLTGISGRMHPPKRSPNPLFTPSPPAKKPKSTDNDQLDFLFRAGPEVKFGSNFSSLPTTSKASGAVGSSLQAQSSGPPDSTVTPPNDNSLDGAELFVGRELKKSLGSSVFEDKTLMSTSVKKEEVHDPSPFHSNNLFSTPTSTTHRLRKRKHGAEEPTDNTGLEPFLPPMSATRHPPKVPKKLGIVTMKEKDIEFQNCGGNIDWTTIKSALESAPSNIYYLEDEEAPVSVLKRLGKVPPKKTFVDSAGKEVQGYDTPSHTRSWTLLPFMYDIPEDGNGQSLFCFDETAVKNHGAAWSCVGLSAKHRGCIPVLPWEKRSCTLCTNGRHRGNSILHDFTLGDKAGTVHFFSWKGAWEEKTVAKRQRTNTPSSEGRATSRPKKESVSLPPGFFDNEE